MVGLEDYDFILRMMLITLVDMLVSLHVIVYRCKPNIIYLV
jgi:hypothetical protein